MSQQPSSSKAAGANPHVSCGGDFAIPIEHHRFVDLSASHWGIHETAEAFMREYHSRSSDARVVVEHLRQMFLGDFWFYNSVAESENAFSFLIDISRNLLRSDVEDKLRERIVQTLLEFVGESSRSKQVAELAVDRCLNVLRECLVEDTLIIIHNSRYFKTQLVEAAQIPGFSKGVFSLTKDVLGKCIQFWESTTNIDDWFQESKALLHHDYGNRVFRVGKPFFSELREQLNKAAEWHTLMNVPSFDEIADYFRRFVDELETAPERIYFIVYLLGLPGTRDLKDYLLWDVSRMLRNVHEQLDGGQFLTLIDRLFDLFDDLKIDCTGAVLDCSLVLGKEAADTEDPKVMESFVQRLIQLGFTMPGTISVTKDWRVQVNENHIKNIRTWLELMEYSPSLMRSLLPALTINLHLGGVFISDTDLFQRDITQLLNSRTAPFYKQIKQLCRIFPVYFSDIGAVSELRDATTAVDELSQGRDILIHFLRKQTHAESNSTHVELARRIIHFWYDGELEPLKEMVPVDVIEAIDRKGEWFVPVNYIVRTLCGHFQCSPLQLAEIDAKELEFALSQITSADERDRKRLQYLLRIYVLLREKYFLQSTNIVLPLTGSRLFGDEDIKRLSDLLAMDDKENALIQVYRLMKRLNQVIFDPKHTEGWENIERKRHIAAGMQSMYGQYREPKFEALGLTLRLEKVASHLMEQTIEHINLDYVTTATLTRIHNVLSLFNEGLEVDGIYNQGFNSDLKMLEFSLSSASFSLHQYVNIFQFLEQDVKEIINQHFLRVYEEPLVVILSRLHTEKQTSSDIEAKQLSAQASENFYRRILAAAFLVQDLDNFVSNTLNTLRNTLDTCPTELIRMVMTYDPTRVISSLSEETPKLDNQVFLGAKAYFLKKLFSLGFPIPRGFVLTTELFRHKEAILKHPQIDREINRFIQDRVIQLEKDTGRQFGNSKNPLLLSVRSGAAFSMPGAMNTFLNVGMNDKIAEELSLRSDFSWAAWDSYRRLLHCWGMAHGIERDTFDKVIGGFKSQYAVEYKAKFTPEQMREIAYEYKEVLHRHGVHFQEEPLLQLRQAIFNTMDSWSSDRTKTYREYLQIADEWGTAVIIQMMVFGNRSSNSGSGVLFTHDPSDDRMGINVYGDFTTCSQGEDIVAGMVYTLPIAGRQLKKYKYEVNISLESAFPHIYRRLVDFASQLIDKHGFSHQEIEFTFESDRPEDLYLLQTRAQDTHKRHTRLVFSTSPDEMQLIARGIGIGSGALSGILAINMDDLKLLAAKYPEEPRVLVRPDTVPDDIAMIFQSHGLLTGRGGATSHAAVTAARLGKVCVVGCRDLVVNEREKLCTIKGVMFRPGDRISIEGFWGNVYSGSYPTEYVETGY